jgi:thiosulfate dehydrogenase [quinone] large subunit
MERTIQIPPASRLDDGRIARAGVAAVRIVFGLLWISQASWKQPPFGALRHFTEFAVSDPVFPPYAWVVEHLVLPNFTFFAWVTTITEAMIGGFLLVGLFARFWTLVGAVQTVAIALSILNVPNEWSWAYYMMFAGHVILFAVAAGRTFGIDGVLRPAWLARGDRIGTWLGRAS